MTPTPPITVASSGRCRRCPPSMRYRSATSSATISTSWCRSGSARTRGTSARSASWPPRSPSAALAAVRLQARRPDGLPHPTHRGAPVPRPPDETASSQQVHLGEQLFTRFNCNDCHSPGGRRRGRLDRRRRDPDLRYMPADVHDQFLAIVMGGTHRANGMPGFADEGFAKGDDWPITKQAMTATRRRPCMRTSFTRSGRPTRTIRREWALTPPLQGSPSPAI